MIKSECATFEGDGSLRYVAEPGFMPPMIVYVEFDAFEMSTGCECQLSFKNLPNINNNYTLYYDSETHIGDCLASNIVVKTILKDSNDNILWDVETTLNEGNPEHPVYSPLYSSYSDSLPIKNCYFSPKKKGRYTLYIFCYVRDCVCKKELCKAYFVLAGDVCR
jgi:hypothetical protein